MNEREKVTPDSLMYYLQGRNFRDAEDLRLLLVRKFGVIDSYTIGREVVIYKDVCEDIKLEIQLVSAGLGTFAYRVGAIKEL